MVIPAYNEEVRIGATLQHVRTFLKEQTWTSEIIVVDDGSKDKTAEIVNAFPEVKLVRQLPNKGKGAAVRKGMLAASGALRLFSDADLSTPIEELPRFIEAAKQADIVIASREIPEAVLAVPQSLPRRVLGRLFSFSVRAILWIPFIDTQCGFKLFTEKAAKTLFTLQRLDGFAFDVELLFLARKNGLRVKELPVTWTNVAGSKVRWRDPFRMLGQVIKIRLNSWAGKYA
ncbi:glycosyltransferase family 2 protein [Candidatus Woesearchaeota archaeon]|nr:glycosyltransferase family 2 protein [Candidatus Woesearchaeota archaeon]